MIGCRFRKVIAAWGLILVGLPTVVAAQFLPLHPAPEISLVGSGRAVRLSQLRGQPVVLLLAPSPRHRSFRRQVRELELTYDRFSSANVLFIAAFEDNSVAPVASNIPFLVASFGSSTCQSYGAQSGFSVAIIGADHNLDYQTRELLRAGRIREVIQNSFTIQRSLRTQ